MTNQPTAATITGPQLDQLYARIETLEHVAAGNKRHVQLLMPELEKAEAALARIRALHQPTGVVAAAEHGNPPDCAVCGENCWPCPTYQAVSEPAPTPPAAPTPVPCPACRRADQAGLAPSEQHDDCAKEQ